MNEFKIENKRLTHTQIVSDYESKLKDLKRDNERLRAYNDTLRTKIENTKYFVNSRIYSLKGSLKKEPDKIKQAQLELCRDVQEELK